MSVSPITKRIYSIRTQRKLNIPQVLFQILDNIAHRTSSTDKHQLDVETFRRPSCAYPNPTFASVQHHLGCRRNTLGDRHPEVTTYPW
jgi:hypothetical protein